MYESRTEPLLGLREFAIRLARHGAVSLALIAGSLAIGAVGYHLTEDLSWLDALLNAAMILTGMGPVSPLHHVSGKLFATFYALYSGVAFLAIAGLLIAPVAHRLLHRLHVDEGEDS
ncbi:MAG: hypothetical protein ABUT39_04200 [Acidobacteriota bacterium]